MKKIIVNVASMFILGAVIFSCEKENPLNSEENELKSQNPYAYVGETHNQALNEYFALGIKGDVYENEIKINQIVQGILVSKFNFNTADFSKEPFYKVQGKTTGDIIEASIFPENADPETYFNNIVEFTSPKEKAVLKQMKEKVKAFGNNKNVLNFNNQMTMMENQLINRNDLESNSKEMLLGTIALARSSAVLWIIENDTIETKNGKWKIAIADAAGFTAGFIGTLVYNNNVEGGALNPFLNGTAVGTLASAAAKGS